MERGRRLRSARTAATARPVRDQPPGLWHGEGTVTSSRAGDKVCRQTPVRRGRLAPVARSRTVVAQSAMRLAVLTYAWFQDEFRGRVGLPYNGRHDA